MSKPTFQVDNTEGPHVTRAWVLHPDIRTDPNRRVAEPALEEAVSLARALPALEVVGADVVPLRQVHPGMLFGSGKIADLKMVFHDAEIEFGQPELAGGFGDAIITVHRQFQAAAQGHAADRSD